MVITNLYKLAAHRTYQGLTYERACVDAAIMDNQGALRLLTVQRIPHWDRLRKHSYDHDTELEIAFPSKAYHAEDEGRVTVRSANYGSYTLTPSSDSGKSDDPNISSMSVKVKDVNDNNDAPIAEENLNGVVQQVEQYIALIRKAASNSKNWSSILKPPSEDCIFDGPDVLARVPSIRLGFGGRIDYC